MNINGFVFSNMAFVAFLAIVVDLRYQCLASRFKSQVVCSLTYHNIRPSYILFGIHVSLFVILNLCMSWVNFPQLTSLCPDFLHVMLECPFVVQIFIQRIYRKNSLRPRSGLQNKYFLCLWQFDWSLLMPLLWCFLAVGCTASYFVRNLLYNFRTRGLRWE